MTQTLADLDRHLRHGWTEPKALLRLEAPFPWPGTDVEEINPDWWEPRWDQPWRRQVARDREEFGGECVARPLPPVEGPNNPDRLRRELERAEGRYDEVKVRLDELNVESMEAFVCVLDLKARVREVGA